jgi:hypothetical protein
MNSSINTSAIADFCKELKEARAFKRISVEEAAALTRISIGYLYALEEGRWREIPAAYLRGYLAVYAAAVEMNCDKVLATFDKLVLPVSGEAQVVLDESAPLLRHPQYVGITRAKIRATWFTSLSQNRRVVSVIMIILCGLYLGLLSWQRHRKITDTVMIPFSISQQENLERVHSPLTEFAISGIAESGKSSLGKPSSLTLVGSSSGSLCVFRDDEAAFQVRFQVYDTIKIQYLQSLTLKVHPSISAAIFVDTIRVMPMKILLGDTSLFTYSITNKIPFDSLALAPKRL